MTDKVAQYLEFLKYCMDGQPLSIDVDKINWSGLYRFASQQSILAVAFAGIERIWNKGANIPRDLLLRWIGDVERIKQRNQLVNKSCAELETLLRKDGYECCILKGQGNATMYPNEYSRTPGDIDVWVRKGDDTDFWEVIEYARKKNPNGIANSIHIDYGVLNGVEVELHFWPTIMNSPIKNKRLHHWVKRHEDDAFYNKVKLPSGDEINFPTVEFNIFYQLSHMYKHVFAEGIGLRQMIDYYYLLKLEKQIPMSEIASTLKYLGLYEFAGAVMYVLHNVFGLEEKKLIAPVDERRGKFIIEEIIRGGNFGKFDTKDNLVKWDNSLGSFLRHVERDFRLISFFPSESLWEPFSRIYQHLWRKKRN